MRLFTKKRPERALDRRKIFLELAAWNDSTGDPLGTIVDMTVEGIRIECLSAIKKRQRFQIRIELPEKLVMGPEVTASVECVRCRKIEGSLYDCGFVFHDLSASERKRIDATAVYLSA